MHPKYFLDRHLAAFGYGFAGRMPPGWVCPPLNGAAVPLLASCSWSGGLGGKKYVALLKGVRGFTGAMRQRWCLFIGHLNCLAAHLFPFPYFLPFLLCVWSYNSLLVSLLAVVLASLLDEKQQNSLGKMWTQ